MEGDIHPSALGIHLSATYKSCEKKVEKENSKAATRI